MRKILFIVSILLFNNGLYGQSLKSELDELKKHLHTYYNMMDLKDVHGNYLDSIQKLKDQIKQTESVQGGING